MTGRPKRVLHAVGAMHRRGVETWLVHALRHTDARRVRMDFLVNSDEPGDYEEEIRRLGGGVVRCAVPRWSPAFRREIGRALRQNGPYDVFHSHVHHFGGYLLQLARAAGVPLRIAHSHSDTSRVDGRAAWPRRCYLRWATAAILRNATTLAAVTKRAALALFGDAWQTDPRRELLRCGIDLSPFRSDGNRRSARAAWGIAENEFVIGHVGHFQAEKNHAFMVQIAKEAIRRRPDTRLLLVGDGPLRPAIEEAVRQAGIEGRVIFAGVRHDVPRILGCTDVFLFPSLWEGLPLSLVEAQAAGLPCVISDVIPEDADIVGELIYRKPLAADARDWAETVLSAGERRAIPSEEALARVEQSSFSIASSIEQLYTLYGA